MKMERLECSVQTSLFLNFVDLAMERIVAPITSRRSPRRSSVASQGADRLGARLVSYVVLVAARIRAYPAEGIGSLAGSHLVAEVEKQAFRRPSGVGHLRLR